MILGVLAGAWLMQRFGSWKGIWVAVATLGVLNLIELYLGVELAFVLGEATRNLFTGGGA